MNTFKCIFCAISLLLISNLYAEDHPFPVGMIAAFPTDSIPEGFIECNGALIDRTTYAELFAVIGTNYGSTTASNFKLPDYRGQFLRGWNNGSGIDPDAATRTDRGDGTTGDVVGSKQGDELKTHTHLFANTDSHDNNSNSSLTATNYLTHRGGNIGNNTDYVLSGTNTAPSKGLTSSAGGPESRPKNISVVWCIRYQSATGGIGSGSGTNIFIGEGAGSQNTGINNTFVGDSSGSSNTAGNRNTFIGRRSGYQNTEGISNTFIGSSSGYNNTTAHNNTFIGHSSGYETSTGMNNSFLGYGSGFNNTTGASNVFLGLYAGRESTAGSKNVYLGEYSGRNAIGSNNVFLGSNSGYNETGSNKLYIENSDSSSPLIYGEFDTDLVQINGELRATGGILTTEVNVKLQSNWPDYVFSGDYQLPSLSEVADHIAEHKHLPGIPSAKEVEKDGISVSDMMTKQMEKIEELTLYLIEKENEIQKLKEENSVLKKETAVLPSILERLNALEAK